MSKQVDCIGSFKVDWVHINCGQVIDRLGVHSNFLYHFLGFRLLDSFCDGVSQDQRIERCQLMLQHSVCVSGGVCAAWGPSSYHLAFTSIYSASDYWWMKDRWRRRASYFFHFSLLRLAAAGAVDSWCEIRKREQEKKKFLRSIMPALSRWGICRIWRLLLFFSADGCCCCCCCWCHSPFNQLR